MASGAVNQTDWNNRWKIVQLQTGEQIKPGADCTKTLSSFLTSLGNERKAVADELKMHDLQI